MCMPSAPKAPPTPPPPAPPAAPPSSVEPELTARQRAKKEQEARGTKKFRNDYKSSNNPSKTTASGLQINK